MIEVKYLFGEDDIIRTRTFDIYEDLGYWVVINYKFIKILDIKDNT